MTEADFEDLLTKVTSDLAAKAARSPFTNSPQFERAVRVALADEGLPVDLHPHPQAFPDISLGRLGVEVKFTEHDTWRSVANSVFEGMRDEHVEVIYVVFGKMGGVPGVRFAKYEDCVMHVRTSHVPRFELDIDATRSLFDKMGIEYDDFRVLPDRDKMRYVREYARGRLRPGEHLWWMDDTQEPRHTLPMEVRLYMRLPQEEKRRLRAEAALLCPQIVKPSRSRNKYNDAVAYLLTYHGVLCPQARDLFSAGSVAMRTDQTRGGRYIERALQDIENEMLSAASQLEDALFEEYWGRSVPPGLRISEWLKLADDYADGWRPSETLFTNHVRQNGC